MIVLNNLNLFFIKNLRIGEFFFYLLGGLRELRNCRAKICNIFQLTKILRKKVLFSRFFCSKSPQMQLQMTIFM